MILTKRAQILTGLCLAFLIGSFSVAYALEADQKTSLVPSTDDETVQLYSQFKAPELNVKAWVLLDYHSGLLVAGHRANDIMPPASITKLMTNFVVYEAIKSGEISLNDDVSISERAWRAEGSRMFAKVNSKVKLEHLLKSTAIQSGNDAAIALAEHAAGSEQAFVARMNNAAHALGMTQSKFANSTGLPAEQHFMSATDIAKLSAAIIRMHPDFYSWYSQKEYTHNNINQRNRNRLLWKDSSVDGIKTGHTDAAGYCLAGAAQRGKDRWIAVVLGADDETIREEAVLSLLNYGFDNFSSITMLDSQGGIASAQVYQGGVDSVRLQPAKIVKLVVPKGQQDRVKIEMQLSPYYTAPIQVGQAMGLVNLSLDGKLLANIPLLAMSTVEEGSLFKQFSDTVKLKWREITSD